ncbi:hypothetical protein [Saccharopolyspora shandongensis]|uniref:hypothetical protein n=1 Tax=Saccharopolyspora shandongensis TaxID=418495 RepID=UPI003404FA91
MADQHEPGKQAPPESDAERTQRLDHVQAGLDAFFEALDSSIGGSNDQRQR